MLKKTGVTTMSAVRGDITAQETDAIVNAANSSLLGGGGVDGAIHRAGGPAILEECREIVARRGSLPPGEAVSTTAGRMKAKRVLHTVGPVWHGGGDGEAEVLEAAYTSCLTLAAEEGLRTVAFPSISTGAYGYPVAEAARVAVEAVEVWVRANRGALDEVRFVLFSEGDLRIWREMLEELI